MGDAHVYVIDHDAELIHGLPKFFVAFARAQQDEVFDLVVRKFALAKNRVRKFRLATDRNFEANRGLHRWRGGLAVAAGTARDAPRPAALRLFILGSRFGIIAAGVFVRGAITAKRGAVRKALLRCRAIQLRSLRLIERPFVPVHAQPLQTIDDALNEFGLVALGVRVLDAQNHHAAVVPREKPVEQGSARSANVQIAGGRRSKADSHARSLLCGVSHFQRVFAAESMVQCSECATFRPTGQNLGMPVTGSFGRPYLHVEMGDERNAYSARRASMGSTVAARREGR